MAMIQKTFCQRKVVFTPAIRIDVISTIIDRPPTKIHSFFGLEVRAPFDHRGVVEEDAERRRGSGPSAKTGKNRAQKVAPIIAESAAPKLEIMASGGDRIRLTQT